MKTINRLFIPAILVGLIFLSSCKTNLLVIEDVLPTARFEGFEPSFNQISFKDFELSMDLSYSFRNPYNKPLAIPKHRMGIVLNETEKLRGVWVEIDANVPAKETITVHYPFKINSNTLKAFLGRENKITFETSIDIDLSEYANMLPNYDLTVTENFDIKSDKVNDALKGLAQKKIKKRKLELKKSINLKLPTLPSISKSNEPILVEWMGGSWDFINLNALKEGLQPFGDLIITGEINQLKNPFIKSLIETTVPIPNPSLNCLLCTKDMKMIDRTLDLVRPLDSNIDQKWTDLQAVLYKENEFSAMQFFVDNFLVKVNSNADEMWTGFVDAWEVFKNTEVPESIPSFETEGFRVSIPFSFKNENHFPVKIPLFRASSFLNDGEPFSIQLRTKDMQEVPLNKIPNQQAEIPAKTTETLYVTFSLNWKDSTNGFYDFLTGQPMTPNLGGVLSYDFGYGPIFIKYDLNNLSLEHEGN